MAGEAVEKPCYVLGTGLSHNGSSVLLKDGRVCVGIEKERLTRIKHDGGNDARTVAYCLDAAGITLDDVALVVQCANFEVPGREHFGGARPFAGRPELPVVSISHHLAHAYSAVGTSPFDTCNVVVIDGCGSPSAQCVDLPDAASGAPEAGMRCEKDSLYHYDGKRLHVLHKDFSGMSGPDGSVSMGLPITRHSIGGFYATVSRYIFGSMSDAGKLMGLAPYGRPEAFDMPAFDFDGDRLLVRDDWQAHFRSPAASVAEFEQRFQYFADVACWAQQQVETAVLRCFSARAARFPHDNWCYSGGVALNAAANSRLLWDGAVRNLYVEPAAADNGIALGCAYYGWLEVLDMPRLRHDGGTCFGRRYGDEEIRACVERGVDGCQVRRVADEAALLVATAQHLAEGRVVGWFQGGAEFGPRALGRRSILADPRRPEMQRHINRDIKRREDFRPFAPSVLSEQRRHYFRHGLDAPYMILLDEVKPEYGEMLQSVVHVDGSARVQTVSAAMEPRFHALIAAFRKITGLGVLLNTSFNKKGMPIVETPAEALELFVGSQLDVLVMEHWMVTKGG